MKTITVTIHNGEAKVETSGFVGKECQTATAQLEAALGLTTDDVATAEMYRPATTAAKLKVGR